MKRLLIIAVVLCMPLLAAAQKHTLRVNTLSLSTATLNIGADIALNYVWSLDVSAMYNPKVNNSAGASIGVKRWLFQTNIGYYIGANALGGVYEMFRKKGNLIGGGFSFGHSWVLSKQWNFSVGGGVGLFAVKDKYVVGSSILRYRERLMILPNKLEVSFSYLF